MPELAEVEFYRKQWNPGVGERIEKVHVHADKRIFRETDGLWLADRLSGKILRSSEAHGKQMLFRFSGRVWIGLHLGMSGKLFSATKNYCPEKHDHLVLFCSNTILAFEDPRQFGAVRLHLGSTPPDWWTSLPLQLLDDNFGVNHVREALHRRSRSSLKAILLDQRFFPGIGNWMADEILWRASLHPSIQGGKLDDTESLSLYNFSKEVSRDAMDVIGANWGIPPVHWLFSHRWKDGGICPKSGKPLVREIIGGRTTCYSPTVQPLL